MAFGLSTLENLTIQNKMFQVKIKKGSEKHAFTTPDMIKALSKYYEHKGRRGINVKLFVLKEGYFSQVSM